MMNLNILKQNCTHIHIPNGEEGKDSSSSIMLANNNRYNIFNISSKRVFPVVELV